MVKQILNNCKVIGIKNYMYNKWLVISGLSFASHF